MEIKRKYFIILLAIVIINLIGLSYLTYNQLSNESKSEIITHYTLYVGLTDKDTHTQLISSKEGFNIVNKVANKYVNGFTTTLGNGFWTNEGILYNETTVICYIDDADTETVHKIANDLKKELNQNSILIEKNSVRREYY